jgi:hypothetical protein
MTAAKGPLVLKYVTGLVIADHLKKPGDCINVFISSNLIISDTPALSDAQVFGSRPYAPTSDIIAMACHMGIVFPSEKPKKSAPNLIFTQPLALKFGTIDLSQFEESRRLDDDFKFYGVVVSVVADAPLDRYPGTPGVGCSSQTCEVPGIISLNIVDFTFISEFEPMPEMTSDPALCLKTYEKEKDVGQLDNGFKYSRAFFTPESTKLLLNDYVIWFVTETLEIGLQSNGELQLVQTVTSEEEEEGTKQKVILSGFDLEELVFGENELRIRDLEYEHIYKMRIVAKFEE